MNEPEAGHRRLIRVLCWIGIAACVIAIVSVAVTEPSDLWPFLFFALVLIHFLASALRRLRPLPRAVGLPMRSACRSISRGNGELSMDTDGSIYFSSKPSETNSFVVGEPSAFERARQIGGKTAAVLGAMFGVILLPTAIIMVLVVVLHLDSTLATFLGTGLTLGLGWLIWRHRNPVQAAPPPQDRSLEIPASRLLAVIPFRRPLLGPSIVVGYRDEGGPETLWEEFFLSKFDSYVDLPSVTGDPEQWAQNSVVVENEPEFREMANRYRRRLHLREGVAIWMASSALFALIMISAFGLIGLGLGSVTIGLVVPGIVILAVSGFIALIEIVAFR